MKILVDKVFIECLNKEYGLNITYSVFKKFYSEVVKPTRDITPAVIKRRKLNSLVNDACSEDMYDLLSGLDNNS